MTALIFRKNFLRSLFGILLIFFIAVPTHASVTVKIGEPFVNLSDFALAGKMPESLRGKIVIVDFWASWCGPCKDSFPVMEELQKKFGNSELVILAVNVDEKQEDMDHFLSAYPVSFHVLRDAQQKLVATIKVGSMPTSFILDGEGKLRFIHRGFHGAETRKQYFQEIEGLIKANGK